MNGWREDGDDTTAEYWRRISESRSAPYTGWKEPEDYIPDSWWKVLIRTELLLLAALFWGLALLIFIALTR